MLLEKNRKNIKVIIGESKIFTEQLLSIFKPIIDTECDLDESNPQLMINKRNHYHIFLFFKIQKSCCAYYFCILHINNRYSCISYHFFLDI